MHKSRGKSGKFVTNATANRRGNALSKNVARQSITSSDNDTIDWHEGRRVIELGVLAEGLGACENNECDRILDLRSTISENRIGLSSILWIQCECGELNKIQTGKFHRQKRKGVPIYDVNTKMAEGILHGGLSFTGAERFLATLQIPPPDQKTMKRREREVGSAVENVADNICKSAQELECLLSSTDNSISPVDITASYDMGWQKRSSGRSYNSRSGHGVLIGKATGKIMSYGSRITNCKQCEVNEAKGIQHEHDCRVNWHGSSKAMEADLAVELLKKCKTPSCRISTIVSDEDATTMSKVRKSVDYEVKKLSDPNHAKKTVGNALYALQKTYKFLSSKVIGYLQKCFAYSLAQNKGNADATRRAILNIVSHVFGDHNICGEWCNFLQDPQRKYTSLPYGRCFTDNKLREELQNIFSCHARNAEKLCHHLSTNPNESFNNVVASKAPKNCHYSKSQSLDYRIASAVCQKNIGENYVKQVNEHIGLSPGKIGAKIGDKRERKFLKRKERDASKKSKKRRIELKVSSSTTIKQREVREGTTYQTSVCLGSIENIQLISIPAPGVPPPMENVSHEVFNSSLFCVFDLETTSLQDNCDIVQISAVSIDGAYSFDKYVLPEKDIATAASNVSGLTKKGSSLFSHGTLVPTVSIAEALSMFSQWLGSFRQVVVLFGHNIKMFDIKHLLNHINKNKLGSNFCNIVGYVDTLPLFKSLYPNETSYSQISLYQHIVGGDYVAHNALEDVKALSKLLLSANTDKATLIRFSMSTSWTSEYYSFISQRKRNAETYYPLLQAKVLSKNMIEKAASSGLTFHHLKVAFVRNGETGLRSLFCEEFQGKPRVTKNTKIIASVIQYFNSLP